MALTDKVEIPRRTMVLFFIIDTSGSMDGDKIGAVNTAVREVVPEIRDISNENADALIKIAVMEFSCGVTWRTPNGPVDSNDYNWTNLDASGTTDFGAMCRALNEKLSTKAFMADATGSYAPALFLLSDGEPTDDWKSGLDKLRQNNWFKASIKVALAIGEGADHNVLKEFTGSLETVIDVKNKAMLMKMIKFVSVRASQVASKSSNAVDPSQGDTGDGAKQAELIQNIEEIKEEVASDPAASQEDW
jgi:uncharacterized protein YegL